MYLSGKLGSRPRISAPSAPPNPAKPEPNANVNVKTAPTLMPRPRATPASRTAARSAEPAAEPGFGDQQLQRYSQQAANQNDEQPVFAHTNAEYNELTPQ